MPTCQQATFAIDPLQSSRRFPSRSLVGICGVNIAGGSHSRPLEEYTPYRERPQEQRMIQHSTYKPLLAPSHTEVLLMGI